MPFSVARVSYVRLAKFTAHPLTRGTENARSKTIPGEPQTGRSANLIYRSIMNLFSILLIVGLLVMGAVTLLAFLSAVSHAPNGHQDKSGFHLDSADPIA